MNAKMTMKFYDDMVDRISENEYKCGGWWPDVSDIEKYIVPNPEEYIEFMIWVLETADEPITEDEKESKKLINRILRHTIEFKNENNYNVKK